MQRGQTPPRKAQPRRKSVAGAAPLGEDEALSASKASFPLSPAALSSVGRAPARRLVPVPRYSLSSEWRTTGSRYLYRWVVRSVAAADGGTNVQLGFVGGWLSARESDFTNAKGRPAGLYRTVYVGSELDGDTEDLELHECTAALWARGPRRYFFARAFSPESTPPRSSSPPPRGPRRLTFRGTPGMRSGKENKCAP